MFCVKIYDLSNNDKRSLALGELQAKANRTPYEIDCAKFI